MVIAPARAGDHNYVKTCKRQLFEFRFFRHFFGTLKIDLMTAVVFVGARMLERRESRCMGGATGYMYPPFCRGYNALHRLGQ